MNPGLLFALLVCGCNRAAVEDAVRAPPDAGRSPDLARPHERCNGIDDDGDGKIDEGCPIRLTTDPADDLDAQLDGNRLVWVRALGGEGELGSVLVRDLPDGAERVLAMNAQYPQVSGKSVAWLSAGQHFILDLDTGAMSQFAPGAQLVQRCAIAGDWLAWSQSTNVASDLYDVYTRNLATGDVEQRNSTSGMNIYPRFSGTLVAWSTNFAFATADCQLTVLDLQTGAQHTIVPPGGNSTCGGVPMLGGGRAIMLDAPNDPASCQLAVYDLASGARTPAGPLGRCEYPEAAGSRFAVVTPGGTATINLDLVDLSTGKWWPLTTYPGVQDDAVVSGNRVVWSDDRHGAFDLYSMDLSDFDDGDFFPEGLPPP